MSNIFITCAAEWGIKIWDKNYKYGKFLDCIFISLLVFRRPLYTFDVNSQVGDVTWAPYSSTTFAAVTIDGKVHIFDLFIDRYNAVCVQAVVPKKKARLNHIAFNPTHPIIIVGDSRGHIQSLKLSPNLRKQTREVRQALLNNDKIKAGELEVKKLDDILGQVRDQHIPNSDKD